MAKNRRVFVCSDCGTHHPRWEGRCNGCGSWASVAEAPVEVAVSKTGSTATATDLPALEDFGLSGCLPVPIGFDEVDSVLGGGLVPGSVTLLSGEPGIGKSTLSLQIAMHAAAPGASVVLVTGEEAPAQVAARGVRTGEIPRSLSVLDNTSVSEVIATLTEAKPQLVVIDSIQTLRCDDVDSAAGSVTQLRSAAAQLVNMAKALNVTVLIIGHVTKDGTLAGPRVLEHLVDTVLSFEGDRMNSLRYLRVAKHRYGSTTDVGVFEMTGQGLVSIRDPSDLFLVDRHPGAPGSVVVPTIEGRRPLLVELQSLVNQSHGMGAHISTQGVPTARVKQAMALLSRYLDVEFVSTEVFVSAAGGAKVNEPGGDLALALSLLSSIRNVSLPANLVACAEVGLAGELRSVPHMERRLQEAHRMGFHLVIVPESAPEPPMGLRLVRARSLFGAVEEIQALSA